MYSQKWQGLVVFPHGIQVQWYVRDGSYKTIWSGCHQGRILRGIFLSKNKKERRINEHHNVAMLQQILAG
jgi:hypothetical protein